MISVCIATYNGEQFLREQLLSILPQLSEADEVIVSDDNSTDQTIQVIAEINDPRIQVYHHEPYTDHNFILDKSTHNFENALRHANGDIIYLSDQDDVWMPNKVAIINQALQDADLVVHDAKVTNEELQPIHPSYFTLRKTRRGVWTNVIRSSYLGCCMAFKRKVLEVALPFPPTGVGHDLWLGIVADKYFRTCLIPTPLLLYRKHHASQTFCGVQNTNSLRYKIRYRITILQEIIRLYLKNQ